MAAAGNSSQARAEEEPPMVPRWKSSDYSSRHPRFDPGGELKTEQHVLKFLKDRGVEVNHVKFDRRDVLDYDSYETCKNMIDRYARKTLVGEEYTASILSKILWETCGIYIK